MNKYIGENRLTYLWGKIKAFVSNAISSVQDEIDTLTNGIPSTEGGNVIDVGEYDLMKINEVKGKSLVMNQLVQNGNFDDNSLWNFNGGSFSCQNNKATITASASNNFFYIQRQRKKDHVYFIRTYITTSSLTSGIWLSSLGGNIGTGSQSTLDRQRLFAFLTAASDTNTWNIGIRDARTANWDAIVVEDFIVVDLTQMFGAGNEPTTVEEVEAILGNEYYEYNTGEVVGNSVEKLDVYDSNETKKGSLVLNLTELTGKVNGEGTSVTIFSDGLHGVGTAYDSLIVDDDGYARRAVKRMGSRAYASGDESDTSVITDNTNTYYPLATPIEYALDTPVQCVAKVYPNGTVKQVPVMPDSTPMVMDVTYLHDNGGVVGGMIGNYATKEYVDDLVGDIETLLASI